MIKLLLFMCFCFLYCPCLIAGGPGSQPTPSVASGSSQGISSLQSIDSVQLEQWHKQAAQGDPKALYSLGLYSGDNEEDQLRYWGEAAALGYGKAQHALGLHWYKKKDFKQAISFLQKAANQDDPDPEVLYRLGICFYTGGEDVPQNYPEAVKWFIKAAKQGHKNALKVLEQTKIPFEILKNLDIQKELDLSGTKIEPGSVPILSAVLPYLISVASVNLAGMDLGDSGITILAADLMKMPTLTQLNLQDNNIGDTGKAALAALEETVKIHR